MSWPIGGAAVVAMALLILGCTQPPGWQGIGFWRAPAKAPAQTAASRRAKAQLASVPAASDYDPNRWQDIEIPPSSGRASTRRPPPPATDAARSIDDQAGGGFPAGTGLSSVRHAPPQRLVRPDGVLSITQIKLESAASTHDLTMDAVDALARRLSQGPRSRVVTVRIPRGAPSFDETVGVRHPVSGIERR